MINTKLSSIIDMNIRTLIIDDEPIALAKLASYVEKEPFLQLVGKCSSSIEALEILRTTTVDLIFTDVNMPDLNGMEMLDSLSSIPMVVFITAYANFAIDSYKYEALDYLLKPYGFSDFQRAANRALDRMQSAVTKDYCEDVMESDSVQGRMLSCGDNMPFFIKTDYKYVRVNPDEIRYIQGYGDYLKIFLYGVAKPLMTFCSFADVREKLSSNFIQIHRNYIVNLNHTHHIERQRVIMDKSTVLPVGEGYKESLQEYLVDLAIGGSVKS